MRGIKLLEAGQHRLIFILFIGVALVLVGCGSNQENVATEPATPVTVQLAWVHTVEYAGFYVAEKNGHYTDENIVVELASGGFDEEGEFIDPVDRVVSGEADFGILSGDRLLKLRSEGAPLVAIATVFQRSPVALVSLAEKNITRPQDLIDASITIDLDSTTGTTFLALLASQNIDLSQINHVPRTDFTNEPILSGQVDVMDAFITNQPIQLTQAGYQINAILPSDYGIDMYANVIFTTEDMIASEPELVERFLRATVRGTQDAVDDPENATTLTLEYNPDLSPEAEIESMRRALPLLNPAGSQPGMMTAENWETAYQILVDQGFLNEPLDVDAAYTLAFLEKIYSE